MKNKIFKVSILFLLLFLLVGCNGKAGFKLFSKRNTLKCEKETIDYDGVKTKEIITVKYDSEKVLSIQTINEIESDSQHLRLAIGLTEMVADMLNEIKGIKVKVEVISDTKYKVTETIDYKVLNIESARDIVGNYDEHSRYLNNYTLEQFKEEHLEDYICK